MGYDSYFTLFSMLSSIPRSSSLMICKISQILFSENIDGFQFLNPNPYQSIVSDLFCAHSFMKLCEILHSYIK